MQRLILSLAAVWMVAASGSVHAELRAGATVVDVTPEKWPVLVNGGMLQRLLDKVKTRVHARALVLSDGKSDAAIVVVDSCMMSRPFLDETKALVEAKTGIRADHLLISATHAHSAPASMGCLGTEADPNYVPFLREKIVEAIAAAKANLEPARIGFGKADAADFTALRRWIRRPDRVIEDPFGNKTVRASMHAGRKWDDVTGESGPKDPDLLLISVQAKNGRPLAVLGNFSMHYYGDQDISADYFGLFCEGLKERIAPEQAAGKPAFVGMLSHGCSGDIWRRDYTRPESDWNASPRNKDINVYAKEILDVAMKAYEGIHYQDDADLAMMERRMTLRYRTPDKQRLEWAKRIVEAMGDRPPKDQTEVYAREQVLLDERQQTEVVVQALRVGDIAIATSPCETYAISGLKLKAASPLQQTMVIELANGGDGYIPPPEQHLFGGYNTWAARSAGLEVTAEPKIVEAGTELLERVTGKPRRVFHLPDGPAAKAVLTASPLAYWRLNEIAGPQAADASGHQRDAVYEREVTYYLEGPRSGSFCADGQKNRAPHLVGGRVRARLADLGAQYSVSMWVWNGLPNEAREVSGWVYSRDRDHGLSAFGEHLGIAGNGGNLGRLIFMAGSDSSTMVAGKTEIPRWQWQHVVLVRDGDKVRVYLNGALEIDATGQTPVLPELDQCFFGGRSDNDSNFEGRIDEVAVFNRALTIEDVAELAGEG